MPNLTNLTNFGDAMVSVSILYCSDNSDHYDRRKLWVRVPPENFKKSLSRAIPSNTQKRITMEALKAKHAQMVREALERRSRWEVQCQKDKREESKDKMDAELELLAIGYVKSSWCMSKAKRCQRFDEVNQKLRESSWMREMRAIAREDRREKAAAALNEEEKQLASLGDEN
ncbi:hypothetical protein SBOR_5382 [Sclerotinia borealis F-4128]|uniref:Uncharacterized protein n=1 Tax=Sclerotinia borealis (strain F-4128) TaxID=1432307 RepID=W9CEG5_SCLBF|nr:hypothetical protein SBOR_5382 [Sclerotinia borealis F-4128]